MSDTLARFHEVLVREIRSNRPEYLEEPFTVAEIYQNLVPYRTHRDALGLEMNGDYEHTLLRLLGGEGEYLELESDVARRQIRDELEHPNPNTGLFRDFAAADVRLTGARHGVSDSRESGSRAEDGGSTRDLADLLAEADQALDPPPTELVTEGEVPSASDDDAGVDEADDEGAAGTVQYDGGTPGEDAIPEGEDVDHEAPRRLFVMAGGDEDEEDHEDHGPSPEFDPQDPTVHAFGGQQDPDEHAGKSGAPTAHGKAEEEGHDTCRWCRADLPPRNVLNFCPYCGSNLGMKPCAECGEELESSWMFCPKCGTEAGN